MAERRTWLWVILGVAALALVAFITFASLVAMMVARGTTITQAGPKEAAGQFEAVRAEFTGQEPLLKITGDSVDDAELKRRTGTTGARQARTLQVLAWERRDQKLVRLSLPIWTLRFSSGGDLEIGSAKVSFERVKLDPHIVEAIGPALVLDAQLDDVDVILWTE